MVPIDLRKSWKRTAVIVAFVAEAAVLLYLGFGVQPPAVDGVVIRPGAASIRVAEQTGPWATFVVERVVTPVPSWVVVQARRGLAGGVGTVMGYTRVPAGTSTDVVVALDPRQGVQNTFIVSLLADAGTPNVFEYSAPPASGGGGGMMGGSSAPAQGAAPSVEATQSIDKPLLAGGKGIWVVVIETMRTGFNGEVTRKVQP